MADNANDVRWLEASLTVDGELAEAVADVMARCVVNGVVVESGVRYNDAEDEGTPTGPVRVYGYMPVDANLEATRQRLEESLWHLGQIQTIPPVVYKMIADQDWMTAWKEHYHPIPIGKRLLVLPAWLEQIPEPFASEQPVRVPVRIDPSMAFGTGTHPTTQLCLELVEAYTHVGDTVIDVGCGSGILSIAALKMGAAYGMAVDIDPMSVRSTGENAAANGIPVGVPGSPLEIGQGSVQELLAGKFTLSQAPLVLANILAPVIIRLFDAGLAQLVLPHGNLVLSGILDTQAEEVVAVAQAHGMRFVERRQIADWVALAFENTLI